MASSQTDRSEAGERTEATAGAVALEREISSPEGGVVVTFVLSTGADERSWIRLEQPLPAAFSSADVGFRKDAAPAEWSVEDGLIQGTGAVPADGAVEFVLGLKLADESAPEPSFPEPELTPCDEPEGPDREATAGPLERESMGPDESEEHAPGTAATDGGTDTEAGPTDGATDTGGDTTEDETDTGGDATADGPDTEDDASGASEGDEDAIIGNEDGELAESIREVVEDEEPSKPAADTPDDEQRPTGRTDGEDPADVPEGDGLEAAVAAVESELDQEADAEEPDAGETDSGEPESETPELDLQSPDAADRTDSDTTAPGESGSDESGSEKPAGDIDIADTTPEAADPGPPLGIDPVGVRSDDDRSDGGVEALVERIERADEAGRERLREALDIAASGGAGSGPSGEGAVEAGTLDVRLRNVESRLSAFEAYEDALEGFIEDTGTVEAVSERATEAVEAATELRSELAGLREDIRAAGEERETLRAELRTATEEREALREEVAGLREDLADVRGLRQQLLGALQSPNGTEPPGGAVSGDD